MKKPIRIDSNKMLFKKNDVFQAFLSDIPTLPVKKIDPFQRG